MKTLRNRPHLTMIVIVCAVLVGVAAASWVMYHRGKSIPVPNAAPLEPNNNQAGANNSSKKAANIEQAASASKKANQRQVRSQPNSKRSSSSGVQFKGPPIRKP